MKKLIVNLLALPALLSTTFADFSSAPVNVFSGVDPKEIRVADIDKDGSEDIVFVDNGEIKILYQNGSVTNASSLRFNGNQNIYVDSSDAFNSANFTISFWVKFPTLPTDPGTQTFFYKAGEGENQYRLIYNNTLNQVEFSIFDTSISNWLAPKSQHGVFSENTWHHVVAVHDTANDSASLIIDQVVVARSRASVEIPVNNQPFSIGAYKDFALPINLDAQIDEFSFFSSALSLEDISLIHNGYKGGDLNQHPKSSDLALWLTMGDSGEQSTVLMENEADNSESAYMINFSEIDYVAETYND